MRFSKLTMPFNRLAGFAAALMILPVAVACDTQSSEVAESPGEMSEEPMAGIEASENGTILEVAVDSGSFDTLISAVQAAGLEAELNSEGPYTVFAPTDEAFAKLPPETLEQLLLPENQGILTQVLAYHVVPGTITADQIETETVTSVGQEELSLVSDATGVTVNGANVIGADMLTSNGVIHAIDTVLLPPSLAAEQAPSEDLPAEVMPEKMPEEMPAGTP